MAAHARRAASRRVQLRVVRVSALGSLCTLSAVNVGGSGSVVTCSMLMGSRLPNYALCVPLAQEDHEDHSGGLNASLPQQGAQLGSMLCLVVGDLQEHVPDLARASVAVGTHVDHLF